MHIEGSHCGSCLRIFHFLQYSPYHKSETEEKLKKKLEKDKNKLIISIDNANIKILNVVLLDYYHSRYTWLKFSYSYLLTSVKAVLIWKVRCQRPFSDQLAQQFLVIIGGIGSRTTCYVSHTQGWPKVIKLICTYILKNMTEYKFINIVIIIFITVGV